MTPTKAALGVPSKVLSIYGFALVVGSTWYLGGPVLSLLAIGIISLGFAALWDLTDSLDRR